MLRVLLWLCLGCLGAVHPAFLLVFFRLGFLRLLRVSSLSLGLRSFSCSCGFFAPVLVHSPPVLPCYVAVAFVCLFFWLARISGSHRDVVSLWDKSDWLQPLYFVVSNCLPMFVSALFLCLVRIGGYLRVIFIFSRWVEFFLGDLSSSGLVFLGVFLFRLVRDASALLLALPCCLSTILVLGLFFLFVLGSFVAPFISSFH